MREVLLVLIFFPLAFCSGYNVGIGIADTTGPAADVMMMGFARTDQKTAGIHTRLFSRAFIFEDDNGDRAVFVSIDMGMMGQQLKEKVVDKLSAREFQGHYSADNVVLSGTHTHSGPGGYLHYFLVSITIGGRVKETSDALVEGIVESIRRAHHNMKPSNLFYAEGKLDNANINRSPAAYLANPQEERNKYDHDTDHLFSQLNIVSAETNATVGLINWFAVHPVSMNGENHLISGDNKGAASLFMEKHMNPDGLVGKGPFVSAFASTNLGDTSPNLDGPVCLDTGLACDFEHSTCNDRNELCVASGPGGDIFQSTKIIGERQFEKALELMDDRSQPITGPIHYKLQYIDMSNQEVTLDDGVSKAKTCKAALGYSFAAGCIDGHGAFNFIQGSNDTIPFWDNLLSTVNLDASPEQIQCQLPKPVLLSTGEYTVPHEWHPAIVDTQMLKIGNLIIGAMPGELTTMAGRRMRDTIRQAAADADADADAADAPHVVLAGLSNIYTHYITTFEEYQKQRYEAASTLFGPHTLRAYQQQYAYLTERLVKNLPVSDVGSPPKIREIDPHPRTKVDHAPEGRDFGDCVLQPNNKVARGDTVVTRFVSGHPKNNQRLEDTFLTVEKKVDNVWQVMFTDADWETKFLFEKLGNRTFFTSEAEIQWNVPEDQDFGTYRIRHKGDKRVSAFRIESFEGLTKEFQVAE